MTVDIHRPARAVVSADPVSIVQGLWMTDLEAGAAHAAATLARLVRGLAARASRPVDARALKIDCLLICADAADVVLTPALEQLVDDDTITLRLALAFHDAAAASVARRRLGELVACAEIIVFDELASFPREGSLLLTLSPRIRLTDAFSAWLHAAAADELDAASDGHGDRPPLLTVTRSGSQASWCAERHGIAPAARVEPFVLRKSAPEEDERVPAEPVAARDDDDTLVAAMVSAGILSITPREASAGTNLVVTGRVGEATRTLWARPLDGEPDIAAIVPPALVCRRPIQISALLARPEGAVRVEGEIAVPPEALSVASLTCYLNRGGAGNPAVRAFAAGAGAVLRYAEDELGPRPGVPFVWGVLRGSDLVIARAKENDQHWFYMDHAYFGRGHYKNYRITRNAYDAGAIREAPLARAAKFGVRLKEWNRNGSIVLVCPPTDYFMAAHGCPDWLPKTLAALKQSTDRPIVVREKPKAGEVVEPLVEALRRTYALVTHSSNVAVEAVVAGTPVFVAETSAAAPVGLTRLDEIERPVYPDREPWVAHLAHSQFSFDELGSGTAWRMLIETEQRPFVEASS